VLRSRHLAIAAAAIGVALASVVFQQVQLRREVRDLRDLVQAGNDRLGEVLQTQRTSPAACADLGPSRHPAVGSGGGADRQETRLLLGPLSPAIHQLIEKGNALIDAAIGRGRWTDRDRDDLRAVLLSIPNEEATPLMNKLFAALNGRQLTYPGPGLPF
jgi:hypothetical protein